MSDIDAENASGDNLQLTDLPDEIVLEIMKNLDFAGALKTGQTCKRFHRISQDESIWKQFLEQDFTPTEREMKPCDEISSLDLYSVLYKRKTKLPLLLWAKSFAERKACLNVYSVITPVLNQQVGNSADAISMM
eukprot:TRINITY_DN2755_c0_g1_i2.p1 TRINITY_DN2755_c0_g1~~TRINITY_DN2755_c0_g1_i2.p1  ORF type:complete len:151 (+),score=28.49 TRINITY_DN2755_c0_g1_i2:53-454(+)